MDTDSPQPRTSGGRRWPRRLRRLLAGLAAAAVLAIAAGAWLLGLVTWEAHTGYLGPAFSRDGKHVYAVRRETGGLTWGMGWEHFTAPAHAYPFFDRFSLIRIEVETGRDEVLESWRSSPVTRRIIREYRGRIFNFASATVRVEHSGAVHYQVGMAIPVVPTSEVHSIAGIWTPAGGRTERGEWVRGGHPGMGPSEPVLSGQIEALVVAGPESYPSAIVLLDHRTMTTHVLAKCGAYPVRYPDGPNVDDLLALSRKKDIDRIAELERVRRDHVDRYRAQGLSEIEALLKSSRDLEDLGYFPRSPRIVATRIAAGTASILPLFDIAEAEMASGVFPDIEKAIAAPGEEIDQSGSYIIHRDFANSAKLNAHFAGGGGDFLVRFRGETWRIELRPGSSAPRE